MDHILYLINKIVLNTLFKKYETLADNLPIQIYINKIKNRVVFKIKTGYKLELLSKETMRLLASTEKVIARNKNGENVPKLEIKDICIVIAIAILVILSITIINKHQKYCSHTYLINNLDN